MVHGSAIPTSFYISTACLCVCCIEGQIYCPYKLLSGTGKKKLLLYSRTIMYIIVYTKCVIDSIGICMRIIYFKIHLLCYSIMLPLCINYAPKLMLNISTLTLWGVLTSNLVVDVKALSTGASYTRI